MALVVADAGIEVEANGHPLAVWNCVSELRYIQPTMPGIYTCELGLLVLL